ncbi:DUF4007 family protein [Hymenobacter sp. NST-14]|uniref:DUF4007 family protein n=1 Tax=Hymenobacter piscis TaxID=2839984 RepID=UPI001C012852|nr:DUF4007 family protein [Hymenobacter piscis]MBT9394806.1 DUF4007 family protein [Hymenobacter piscis]
MQQEISSERLGLSFHRGFTFSRTGVVSVLKAFAAGNDIQLHTDLGSVQLEAMPRYCERAGLVNSNKKPTEFGDFVLENDLNITRVETLWLIHYFLSAPHRSAPNFWSFIVSNCFVLGKTLNRTIITDAVAAFALKTANATFSERTLESVSTAMLGSYSKPENLEKLGLLKSQNSNQYTVTQPQPIPLPAFACMLADFWQAHYPNDDTIFLTDLLRSELGRILLLSEAQFKAFLAALAAPSVALVQRQERTPPYTITRRWHSIGEVWEKLYQ